MPLMMPSSFHPTGDGDYLLLGDDHGQNVQEIRRHSPHDADAYDRYHHDLDRVVPGDPAAVRQPAAQRLRQGPRGPGRRRVAARPPRRRRAEGDARRRPAAHRQRLGLARGLLRARGGQGLPRVLEHHRLEGRPDVSRLRPGAAVPQDGRARRPPRLVGVPQGRQRRLHPGARPGGRGVRRGDPARRPGRRRAHPGGPRRRRRARGRHRAPRAGRGVGARPAAYLPRPASTPASCPPTWSTTSSG